MANKTNGESEAQDSAPPPEAEAPQAPEEGADAGAQPAPAQAPEAREAELKDKLLRALAETENLRRRAERERQDALQYGIARFARDILGIVDSLQRALASVSDEMRADASEPVKNLIAGIELTEKELLRVLERYGVKRIEAEGLAFNPHLHQAIAQVPAADKPEGTVINVAQVGYTIGGRLLRPTMVVITTKPDGGDGGAGGAGGAPGSAVDTSA
jgi:molecular chaperone GrpE